MSDNYTNSRSSRSQAESARRTADAPLKRYPPSGGYACGKRTRARIITAALRVFREHGYDRASTRKIAECAGVNTPAIRYYFGSKRGLHLACTRHMMERVSSILARPLSRAGHALRATDPTAALGALCDLLVAVVDGLWAAGSENWSPGLMCVTGEGGKPVQTVIPKPIGAGLFDTMVHLIAIATHDSAVTTLARLRACVLLGCVSSLYENRAQTLAVMGWSDFDENARTAIKSLVREHTRGALATAHEFKAQAEGRD